MGGDQKVEMRGEGKDATANIVTGAVTAAEAAAEKDIGSIGGGTKTTMPNRPHAMTAGVTGA